MKQTLTELAEILRAVDAGAEWEWNNPSGQETDWCYAKGAANPLFFAAQGWPIRLKPAEPDAEGWIPWKGGICPVQKGVLVDVKYRDGSVQSKLPANTHIYNDERDAGPAFWERDNESTDIVAYRPHKADKEPEPDPHPNRAEVEEGIRQGRKWQYRTKGRNEPWKDDVGPPLWFPDFEYRLEPEPEYMPFDPEDVPPGSVFRGDAWQGEWRNCYIHGGDITPHGVALHRSSTYTTWQSLFDGWQINRSLPLTGKWDPQAWEPCRKLKGGDNE